MKAKHCPNCGVALEGEGRFCPECGFDLSSAAAKEKKLPSNEDKDGLDYLSSAFDDQLEERAKKKKRIQNAFFFLKTGKFNEAYKTFDSILDSEPLDVDARVGLIGCKSKGFANGYPECCDDWKLLLGLSKESVLLAKYPELKSFKDIVAKEDELLNQTIPLYTRVPFGKWTGIDNECYVIENSGTKVKLMTYHAAGEFKNADYPSVNELLKALNGKLLDTLIPKEDRKKLVPFENGSFLSLPSVEELVSASFYFARRGFGALNASEDASKTPNALLSGEKQANLTYFLNGKELNKGPLPKVFRLCPTFWIEKKWIVHSQGIRPPCLPEQESIVMGNYGGFPIRWIKFDDEEEPFDYYLALTPFFPDEELQVSESWVGSPVAKFLNEKVFPSCFSEKEKERFLPADEGDNFMTLLDVYDDFYPFYRGLFIYAARFLFKNVYKENGNLFYGACDFTKAKHNQAKWGDFVTPFKGRLSEVGIRPLIRLLKPSSRASKTKFTFDKDKSSRYKEMRKVAQERAKDLVASTKESNPLDMLSYEIAKDGGILVTGISPQFKEFKSLKLSIPSNVSSLAPSAFEGCDNLESVEFACSIKEIPEKLFCGCTHLEKVTFAKGCNALKRIGKSAFACCTNLKGIKLPDTVETIDDLAFSDSGLAKFVVPKGLKSLSLKALEGCSNLKKVDGESKTYWTSFDCLFKGPKVNRYPVAGLFKKAKLKKIRQMELPILLFCFDGQVLFPVDDPKDYKYDVELNKIPYFIGSVDVNAFSLFNLGRKFGRVFFPPELDVMADVPHSVISKLKAQGVYVTNHD